MPSMIADTKANAVFSFSAITSPNITFINNMHTFLQAQDQIMSHLQGWAPAQPTTSNFGKQL